MKWKSICRQARGRTNTKLLTRCGKCRRSRGFIFSYYASTMEGTKYPVDVEDMYINCDEWDEFYNETVAKVAQAILEAEQIKEA